MVRRPCAAVPGPGRRSGGMLLGQFLQVVRHGQVGNGLAQFLQRVRGIFLLIVLHQAADMSQPRLDLFVAQGRLRLGGFLRGRLGLGGARR